MYITTKDGIKIEWTYNPRPTVKVSGGNEGEVYLVQIFEYYKNNSVPFFLESYLVENGNSFQYNVSYFGKFELRVIRFDEKYGHTEIFRDVYDDLGQKVKFVLKTQSFDEETDFYNVVSKYITQSKCVPTIVSSLENTTRFQYQADTDIDYTVDFDNEYYKTYYIGRNEFNGDNLYEHRWRKVSYGNWRLFWSQNNPREYHNLTSTQIVEDLLGFTEKYNDNNGFVVTPSYL